MPLAKRVLAKITRFYRRLKQRRNVMAREPMRRIHRCKNCGAIFHIKLDHYEMRLQLPEPQPSISSPRHGIRITTQAQIEIEPREPTPIAEPKTPIPKPEEPQRCAAGEEIERDDGPMLENGISKSAFCRQLDELLKRSLNTDHSRPPVWSKADSALRFKHN